MEEDYVEARRGNVINKNYCDYRQLVPAGLVVAFGLMHRGPALRCD